jgi:hypothetical protein
MGRSGEPLPDRMVEFIDDDVVVIVRRRPLHELLRVERLDRHEEMVDARRRFAAHQPIAKVQVPQDRMKAFQALA